MILKSPMFACSKQPDLNKIQYPVYASFKLDGIRCVTPNDQVLSRTLKPIPNKFIQKQLAAMPVTLDGELMLNGSFNDVSSGIMSEEGEPDFVYMVFDLPGHGGTFEARYKELSLVVQELGRWLPRIKLVQQKFCRNKQDVEELYKEALAKGYEGLILRKPNSPYKQGRSTLPQEYMLKVKPNLDKEVTVIGFTEMMHNYNESEINELGYSARNKKQDGMVNSGMLGALICLDENNQEVLIGSGFTKEQRIEIWLNQDTYIGKPVTMKYQEQMVTGGYRFPVFKCFRKDI